MRLIIGALRALALSKPTAGSSPRRFLTVAPIPKDRQALYHFTGADAN